MTSDDRRAEELETPQNMMHAAAKLGREGKGAEADAMYRRAAAGFEAEGNLVRAAQALSFARAKAEADAMFKRAASQPS
jgi:hypothetical protein